MTTVGSIGMNNLNNVYPEKFTKEPQKEIDIAQELSQNQLAEQKNEPQRPLSPNDLDCSKFLKKDRARAKSDARNALDRVKDAVAEYNKDFPAKPYVLDYSLFPDPAKYNKKDYGNRSEAFHAWKEDVQIWMNDRLAEIKNSEEQSQEAQHNQQMNALLSLWNRFGVTESMLKFYCETTNQNINNLTKVTYEKAEEIKQFVETKVDKATYVINRNTVAVGNNIVTNIEDNINNIQVNINNEIASNETKKTEESNALKSLKQELYLSWNNDQNITKKALDRVLARQGKEYDRTHFTDGTQIESAAATNGLIENLDAKTIEEVLKEIKKMKTPVSNSNLPPRGRGAVGWANGLAK